MIEIPIRIEGLKVFIENQDFKPIFQYKSEEFKRIYWGKNKGKTKKFITTRALYKHIPNKGFYTGLGCVLWLSMYNKNIKFKIEGDLGFHKLKKDLEVPEKIKNNKKFKVNGVERYYFYESLKTCFNRPIGNTKLPTGSGKTPIQLTLAYNQLKELGCGLIIVPTITIKDQFIKSVDGFGIENFIDFESIKLNLNLEDFKNKVIISTAKILGDGVKNKNNNIINFLKQINWVIGDEIHHSNSKTWHNILYSLDKCKRLHGFSALPITTNNNSGNFSDLTLEDSKIIELMGPVIYQKSSKELKEFLNVPGLISFKYKWNKEFPITNDWIKIRNLIKQNYKRSLLISNILDKLVNNNLKVITFVSDKSHANEIIKNCNSNQIYCWFGGEKVYNNLEEINNSDFIRKNFGNKVLGIICTSHAVEGLDLDDPVNVLLIHEGKSNRQNIQKTGRIVRPDDSESYVVNLYDLDYPVLRKHSKNRENDIIEEFDCNYHECDNTLELLDIINKNT